MLVNGGDEDETPGVYDWVMHVISVFWKVIFVAMRPDLGPVYALADAEGRRSGISLRLARPTSGALHPCEL